VHVLELAPHQVQELERVELRLAAVAAQRVQRGLQEVDVVDARNFDRILEREESPSRARSSGAIASRSRPR
jgi:hypothetical protein